MHGLSVWGVIPMPLVGIDEDRWSLPINTVEMAKKVCQENKMECSDTVIVRFDNAKKLGLYQGSAASDLDLAKEDIGSCNLWRGAEEAKDDNSFVAPSIVDDLKQAEIGMTQLWK